MGNNIKIVIKPKGEVISLSDMRLHLRVSDTAEDELIKSLIDAGVQWSEMYTRRLLINQQWQMTLDCFPVSWFYLPRSPTFTLDSIIYTDTDGQEITVSTDVYGVDEGELVPSRVFLKSGQVWPSDVLNQFSTVKVLFTAGYGLNGKCIPQDFIAAIKLLVGHWYENREEVVIGTISSEVPGTVKRLLSGKKIIEEKITP